jgi:hypothetical protein
MKLYIEIVKDSPYLNIDAKKWLLSANYLNQMFSHINITVVA